MLLLMHESPVRGKLMLGNGPMSEEALARILHINGDVIKRTVETLIESGVTERETRTGALINRRMVRDENARSKNRGKLHNWRKAKKTKEVCNQNVTPRETEMKPLSSSSSSSSSSIQEQKQKPSRGKREQPTKTAIQKQAHADFKAAIDAYWKFKNPGVQMPWGPMEGAQLSMFQREAPHISLEQFKGMLNARAKSKVNHGDRPGQWIKWITSYGPGPVNEFKNTMEVNGNGGTDKTNRVGVTAERTKAARTSLAEAALARGYYTVDDALRSADPPLPGAGERGSDAGISGGLRSVSGEVLNPGGRASGGGSTG
jgi:DNA-binding transcriptional regulator YhcF (GntR family)